MIGSQRRMEMSTWQPRMNWVNSARRCSSGVSFAEGGPMVTMCASGPGRPTT